MNRKKMNILKIILSIVSVFFVNACSGKGSGSSENNATSIAMCDANTTTIVNKGDNVIAQTDDTELRVIHKQEGTRSVCVVNGEAKVTSI